MNSALKPIKAKISLRVWAGVAKPGPKMGQALGPLGINMMQFCKDFNAKTDKIRADVPLRVSLLAYHDRTYSFFVKPPPTSWLIKKAIGKDKLTNYTGWLFMDKIGIKYIYEIAKIKKDLDPDLYHSIIGQCTSMGIAVVIDQEKPAVIKPPMKI